MKKIYICISFLFIFYSSYSQLDTLVFDGIDRTYHVHLPVNYSPDTLYPLVINMHGLGSNDWEQEIYTGFNNVADTGRFIVAYPNGLDETWNVSSSSGTDDVGFISTLIDTVNYLYGIDLQRVYATGMSMGGFMSYRLACELSNRIAAIASVAGLQAFYPCTPSRPVPIMHIHGTSDQVVPYIGVSTTITNWTGYNGCPTDPVITELPDIDTNDNSTVTVSYYGICNDSSEVMLYTINGGEHTWPGAQIIIGITNQDINASNEIWGFFEEHPMQGYNEISEKGIANSEKIRFYPNPVSNYATVELYKFAGKLFNFRLYDLNGIKCLELSGLNSASFAIDCSDLAPGLYITEIEIDGVNNYDKLIVR